MRWAMAGGLVLWAALFAAVVVHSSGGGAPSGPAAAGGAPRPWAVLERSGTPWVEVRGPFRNAEACLSESDRLNNADLQRVYDCDPLPAAAARTHPPLRPIRPA